MGLAKQRIARMSTCRHYSRCTCSCNGQVLLHVFGSGSDLRCDANHNHSHSGIVSCLVAFKDHIAGANQACFWIFATMTWRLNIVNVESLSSCSACLHCCCTIILRWNRFSKSSFSKKLFLRRSSTGGWAEKYKHDCTSILPKKHKWTAIFNECSLRRIVSFSQKSRTYHLTFLQAECSHFFMALGIPLKS